MNKIKSITGFTSFIGDDGTEFNEHKSTYQEFNTGHEMIKDITFTQEGEIETASGYKFDEFGNLTEELHYLNDTEVAEKLTFKYESDGELKEIETTYSDGSKSIQKRIRHGHELFIKTFDEDNRIEGEEVQKFDSKGNILERMVYDEDKTIQQKFTYEYDGKDLLKSIIEYGMKEEFIIKKNFEYNAGGQPVKELHFSERGKLFNTIVSEYNDKGNLISQRSGNSLLTRISYDDKGRKIKEETIDLSTGTTVAFKINTYDDIGLLSETISYDMGQEFQMEPGLFARSGSRRVKTKFQYEFFAP